MSLRLVVMVSGGGSNLQAILDAIADGSLDAEVIAVVSNRAAAFALQRAEKAEVSTMYAPLAPYRKAGRTREDYDADLAAMVSRLEPDVIVLAGWMHILSPAFLDGVTAKVLNLHPALPGEYPGVNAIQRAWEDARVGTVTRSGIMVHEVVPEIDAGPVVGMAEVPVKKGEPLEIFEARMHATEHELLVDCLRGMTGALDGADA
jgi:formyltetrahydrofolate-dependent phosphoribosylglycinamide formyltransferase